MLTSYQDGRLLAISRTYVQSCAHYPFPLSSVTKGEHSTKAGCSAQISSLSCSSLYDEAPS